MVKIDWLPKEIRRNLIKELTILYVIHKFGPIKGRRKLHELLYKLKWQYGLPIPFLFVNKDD